MIRVVGFPKLTVAESENSREIDGMANNTYQALTDSLVKSRADDLGTTNQDEAFMSVAHEQVLLKFDLSKDDIDGGLTDGSLDGQIDAMYVIVNGASLRGEEGEEISYSAPLMLGDVQRRSLSPMRIMSVCSPTNIHLIASSTSSWQNARS